MANKKVFTNLQFEGSSELINPRLHPTGTEPTIAGAGHLYYDSSNDKKYLRLATASDTYVNIPTSTSGTSTTPFDLGGYLNFSATGRAPFTVADSTVVAGLNAAQVAGKVPNAAANAGDIPIYGTNGVLKVSDPLSLDDAANRRYVDSAVQGLDHKESVRLATTGALGGSLSGTTFTGSGGGLVSVDSVELVAGNRLLVKNQTTDAQNGIYTVTNPGAPNVPFILKRATDAAEGPNLLGDDGNFNADEDLDAWNHNSIGTQARDSSNGFLKLTNAASGSDMRARTNSIALATEIGKTYKFSYFNSAGTANGFCHLGTASGGSDIKANVSESAGTHTFTWQATSAVVYIQFGVASASANVHTSFDDVSIVQVELTDGAFVFVEEGDTQVNSSWVLNGTTWTQFGKAGMIDVTSNGAVAAPLTKSGDTIDFRYSLDNALSTTSAVSLVDPAASVFTSGVYGWTRYNSNTIDNVGSALVITHVNNSEGAYVTLRDSADLTGDLVVGRKYRLKADAFYTGGSSGSKLQVKLSGSTVDSAVLTTSSVAYTIDFTADTATGVKFHQSGMGTDNVVTIDNWNLYELDALTVKSGGIDTVHLADDAVEPAKLQDTGEFQMAKLGLGVAPTSKLHIKDATNPPEILFEDAAGGTQTAKIVYDQSGQNSLVLSTQYNSSTNVIQLAPADNVAMTLQGSGKVGIGQDATSPSGTLHVSTARFGSDNVSGWDINDGTWSKNSYTTIVDSNTFTTSQGGAGPWKNAVLTVGKTYKVTVAGSTDAASGFNFVNSDGGSGNNLIGSGFGTFTFVAIAGGIYLRNASGGTTDITSLTIVEDTLTTNGTSGVAFTPTIVANSGSDDIVVSNNDHGGITLLNPADKKGTIFFADKDDNDVGSIKYNHADNSLAFHTNGATASLELDSSQNVKVNGGLGLVG